MVAIPTFTRLTVPLATAVAAVGGGLAALTFLVMPTSLLERLVAASGFPSILAAAEPPLGMTARIGLAILFGGGAAAFLWCGSYLVAGSRTVSLGGGDATGRQRSADAHPDAPPREPLLANRDLGTPSLQVKAEPVAAASIDFATPPEQPLPVDLDRPMAQFDPRAILAEPLAAPVAVAPMPLPKPVLVPQFEPDRSAPSSLRVARPQPAPAARSLRYDPNTIGTNNRAPLRADEPVRSSAPAVEGSITELLARLERSIASSRPRSQGLDEALGDLRRLAVMRR